MPLSVSSLRAQGSALHGTFDREGYVGVRRFLAPDELCDARRRIERFLRDVLPSLPPEQVYYEDPDDPASLKQVQQLWRHDPWFEQLMVGGKAQALAELLLGAAAVPKNLQYFNKPRRGGLATPAHQDGAYFPLFPNHAVTLWLALQDVGRGQGRMRYLRGSHRDGLQAHETSGTLGFSRRVLGMHEQGADPREVVLTCTAGDLFAHHSLTVHRSGANTSGRDRPALGFVYYAVGSREDEATAARYQARLDRRLRSEGRLPGDSTVRPQADC